MSIISVTYPTLADYIGWLEERAEENLRTANGHNLKREQIRFRARADVYAAIAKDLRNGVTISELDEKGIER